LNVLIADTETDGFLDSLTRIWTLQIATLDSDEVDVYADQPGYRPIAEGVERLRKADRIVFHNGIRFDYWVMDRFYPGAVPLEKLYDTMVVSRLIDPQERQHSLKALGKKLGIEKDDYDGGFDKFSPEMVSYGKQDIRVGKAIYLDQQKVIHDWGISVWLEHMTAYVIFLQERNGFLLDVKAARELDAELRQEMQDVERELQVCFPPITTEVEWTPKASNRKLGYVKGVPMTKRVVETFSPGSRQQIGKRLMAKYGWKPKKWTPTGIPTVDEDVLANLDYPEAKLLSTYLDLEKRLGQVSDGKSGWLKLVKDTGRVHGVVNTNGAATGRMSHSKPNMAQVNKKDLRMRAAWLARPGWKLVGCDAEGIEARMLGHYLVPFDNGKVIERIISGKKEDGTDLHSANLAVLKRIGMQTRDGCKTELYALIYGASDPKLGQTIIDDCRNSGVTPPKTNKKQLGATARLLLAKSMVGIDKLTHGVASRIGKVKRHHIKGLDGRRITLKSKHSALNYLLQGAGAIAMKMALVIFHFETAVKNGWVHGVDFGYCANVHDEVQIECRPEIAEEIGKGFAAAITEAGVRLGVRCPLAGAYSVGSNWRETH